MDRVYIVWAGKYNDPYVDKIFSNKDVAEEYARIRTEKEGDSPRRGWFVKPYDLCEESNKDGVMSNYVYGICILYDYKRRKIINKTILNASNNRQLQNDCDVIYENKSGDGFWLTIARPYLEELRDPITDDRLLKIAQDRWAQFKARMEGIG